jgi:pyruvate dehydrogenase E1 component beta subunit
MKYAEELKRSMELLAQNDKVIFLGQAVSDKGTAMTNSLENVSEDKKIEWTVTEDMQMGASIGMALEGLIPVSLYPRWNFLCLATNQIVNHLDKLPAMSDGQYSPRVIIRTSIGAQRPLHPQHQHVDDFTEAYRLMCPNVNIVRLDEPEEIYPAYEKALTREDSKSTILVEWGDYHGEK